MPPSPSQREPSGERAAARRKPSGERARATDNEPSGERVRATGSESSGERVRATGSESSGERARATGNEPSGRRRQAGDIEPSGERPRSGERAPSDRRTGRPPRISRAEIVAAAHKVLDAEGVEKLTMRRLATELGCTPMALYHHVRDKDDLLRVLLNDYVDQVTWPDLPDDPKQRILVAATAMHDVLAARPWIVEVLTEGDLFGLSALWVSENIIDAAVDAGLSLDRAAHAYRAIWHYTAGEILIRGNAVRRADVERPTFRDQVFADLDPETLPRLAELGPRWADLSAADTYADGLRALVDGLIDRR
ncbi:TetR/AcrR family transcriptional regulator [Nocardia amikacinitolerans]|uniref:TetR/AcrR family transcriptional regulator n=1 Tax=Nocardia amikacinitolerans TaxID=756689 RepID=UPI0020A55743|nr:TetR family transcriptional regulator [Nocardia amikacinitolerans]